MVVPWSLEQEYVRQMPMVWMRERSRNRNRFHASPDCRQLRKKPAYGEAHPLIAVDLNEVFVRPCRTCYPDAPHIEIRRAYCYICDSRRPCEHNGGVQIVRHHGSRFWVWPDTNQMPYFRTTL
jgi:hypothetical protein